MLIDKDDAVFPTLTLASLLWFIFNSAGLIDTAFSLQSILSPSVIATSLSAVVSPSANCEPVVSTTNFPVIVSGGAIVNLLDQNVSICPSL